MAEQMETCIVAPRRSVMVGGAPAVALDEPGSTGFKTPWTEGEIKGPGEQIRVPKSEAARLRKLGAVVDPDAPNIPVAAGPSFDLIDGQPAAIAG